jgi:tetratricopeptide (TPR) repeat protein
MKRDSKILLLLILGASIYSYLKFNTRKTSDERAIEFIAEARKIGGNFTLPTQSPVIKLIDSLILYQRFSEAFLVLDTAYIMETTKLNYKGEIFFKQGKIRESIDAFTQAINSGGEAPLYFANRAKVYVVAEKYDSAIVDYKHCASWNHDFYRPLAATFKKSKQKDSALKYFKLFLNYYPDSISVKQCIKDIENRG